MHALCTKAVGVEFGEGVEGETEAILGGRETHVAEQGRYHHAFFTFRVETVRCVEGEGEWG